MKAELWNFSCQMLEFCCCEQCKDSEMGYVLYCGAFSIHRLLVTKIVQFSTSCQWPGHIVFKAYVLELCKTDWEK
jgi:hypothetical protein